MTHGESKPCCRRTRLRSTETASSQQTRRDFTDARSRRLGVFRVVSADAFIDDPFLADGQVLTLILLPLLSLGLVCVVVCETLATGYRVLRSDRSVREQLTARPGYTVLRGIEAGVAVAGVTFIVAAVPVLLADSTPAPAGVGVMLALMLAGIGILVASFVRALLELAYYATRPESR